MGGSGLGTGVDEEGTGREVESPLHGEGTGGSVFAGCEDGDNVGGTDFAGKAEGTSKGGEFGDERGGLDG